MKQFVIPTDTPVAAETIADAIIGISESMKKLSTSGLNRRAIVELVHANSGVPKRQIELIINNLESLRETWCSR
jgi:hypothetical protein